MSEADGAGFRHQALMYSGPDDFAAQAMRYIVPALEAEEPVLVAVDEAKIAVLRDRLGSAADSVACKDIRSIGGNPARIIPLWRRFVAGHRGSGRVLGFGEPVWPGRSPAELVEAQRHERLLNLAFARTDGFTLICPYDTALDAAVLRAVRRTHPFVNGAEAHPSTVLAPPFDEPLADPPGRPHELSLEGVSPVGVRRFLADQSAAAGGVPARLDDLTIAIAAVTASIGRPGARLRVWREAGAVLAELRDLEPVEDPLAGREWPPPSRGRTRGVWLANQLCDLVQLRSSARAAVVRLQVGR